MMALPHAAPIRVPEWSRVGMGICQKSKPSKRPRSCLPMVTNIAAFFLSTAASPIFPHSLISPELSRHRAL
jgi:hypothetical protein